VKRAPTADRDEHDGTMDTMNNKVFVVLIASFVSIVPTAVGRDVEVRR
jgi:hypothetical protein